LDQSLGFRVRLNPELLIESGFELAIPSQRSRTPAKGRLDRHRPSDEVLADWISLDRSIEDRQGFVVLLRS